MVKADPLPDEQQRLAICELFHFAFVELRAINDRPEQVHELADAFHNLPKTIYGRGLWIASDARAMLQEYRKRFPEGGLVYAAMFDLIFPELEARSPDKSP